MEAFVGLQCLSLVPSNFESLASSLFNSCQQAPALPIRPALPQADHWNTASEGLGPVGVVKDNGTLAWPVFIGWVC